MGGKQAEPHELRAVPPCYCRILPVTGTPIVMHVSPSPLSATNTLPVSNAPPSIGEFVGVGVHYCARPLGPELRQGLDLFRVVSRTGLQIRKEIGLDSDPCGRLYAGDVFYVNHSSTVPHQAPAHRQGKKEKRRGGRLLRVTRLHIVAPRIGWVTGSSKWVSKFQDGSGRPGPIPLRSTLSETSPVIMVKPSENHIFNVRVPARPVCDRTAQRCGHEQPETQVTHRCPASTMPSRMHHETKESSTRAKWLYSR